MGRPFRLPPHRHSRIFVNLKEVTLLKNMKAVVIALALAALAVAGSAPFVIYPW